MNFRKVAVQNNSLKSIRRVVTKPAKERASDTYFGKRWQELMVQNLVKSFRQIKKHSGNRRALIQMTGPVADDNKQGILR